MSSHILPKRVYYTIFAILLFCTYLTVQIAFLDLGTMNTVAALGIATFKAALVILCFMHIWWEANWKFVLTIPAALMSVFLILMLVPDIGMRMRHASEERLHQAALPRSEASSKAAQPHSAEHAP